MPEIHSQGWCCDDCLFLFANGDTPVDWDEERTQAWLDEIARRSEGLDIAIGGEHDFDCKNVDEDGNWVGNTDCSCEEREFDTTQCSTCGTRLHGRRHAVTYFERSTSAHPAQ
jgi:hypothetical protein